MSASVLTLPYITPDLPGTGGLLRASQDDFRVDEILAYEPEGAGDHVFVHIEKRGLTTPAAAETLARALGVHSADIGWAGMKDKHAITRQTLSLPPPCTPEAVLAVQTEGIEVLAAVRHRHKLRTGHLRGNRFTLRIRDLDTDAVAAAARAQAVLDRLSQPPGCPNYFGAQRFGRRGDNAEVGRAVVTGGELPTGVRRPRGRELRLYVSALQSQLFNEYLAQRITDVLLGRVLAGDLLQKTDSGGIFASTEPEADQQRLDAGEVVPTGPMFGHRVKEPPAGSPAAERELAVLAAHGLEPGIFARVGKLGMGTRRALAVRLSGATAMATIVPGQDDAIELSFELPAGSYATAVAREVVKGPTSFPE